MSARVPQWYPQSADVDATYIARPATTGLFGGYVDQIAHLGGHQLSLIHYQSFGTSEQYAGAGNYTYRVLYQASPNAGNIAYYFLPYGTGASGAPPTGTITVAGADAPTQLDVFQQIAGISDLGDLVDAGITFTETATPGAIQELTYEVDGCRLHSVAIWEVPRATLGSPAGGTHEYVDQTFGSADYYITDDEVANDPRGYQELLNQISDLRTRQRRHFNWHINSPVTTNAAAPAWGSLWPDIRARARDVSNAANTRCRFFVYVGGVGASTWTVRIRDAATADTATIAGINAGNSWWDSTGAGAPVTIADGAAFNLSATAVDTLVVEAQRTAGAGTLEVHGVALIEDPA